MSDSRARLGIRANLPQFTLFSILTLWVGWFLGMERVVVPILARDAFAISSFFLVLSFIAVFGFAKAILNMVAGRLSDKLGRKRVLVIGWIIGLPIPFILIFAPSWSWVILANVLMGVNQAIAWTMTVTCQIDLVGTKRTGFALGINEFSGYAGQASGIVIAGYLATSFGLRPFPFYFGLAAVILGLASSVFLGRETMAYTKLEQPRDEDGGNHDSVDRYFEAEGNSSSIAPSSFFSIFSSTSWRNKTLFSCSQAGLAEKFTDTLLWGIYPLFLAGRGVDLITIGLVVGLYQAVWGVFQLFTGGLSDSIGRKAVIVSGMWLMSFGILLAAVEESLPFFYLSSIVIGSGMALVYPVLMASVSDLTRPAERGAVLGIYRLWRDSGYGFGAILIGLIADGSGIVSSFYFSSILLFISGFVSLILMKETLKKRAA